eukprot:8407472-Pyramimonas_sp.AAC.1
MDDVCGFVLSPYSSRDVGGCQLLGRRLYARDKAVSVGRPGAHHADLDGVMDQWLYPLLKELWVAPELRDVGGPFKLVHTRLLSPTELALCGQRRARRRSQ